MAPNAAFLGELTETPYEIRHPTEQKTPLVFASPHSGSDYPADFLKASRLDATAVRRSEDAFVDELYETAPERGAPLIAAAFPRAYVDPNREPYELDPEMFASPLPGFVNQTSPRIAAGLGTIAKVVTNGEDIYHRKLTLQEGLTRIERLYRPYHGALRRLIDQTRARFGHCLLIDCHSMPSIGGPMDRDPGSDRVDFVLGDCHGQSAAPQVMDWVENFLIGKGYVVKRNAPYAGGFTTRHYGTPEDGVHALQIEVNRALYMDETEITRSDGMSGLKGVIDGLIAHLTAFDFTQLPKIDSPKLTIRDAVPEDIAAITEIYGHYVANTAATFEEIPPSSDEIYDRWQRRIEEGYPYLVAERGGKLVGFAYAAQFRQRSAFRFMAENSIYVAADEMRGGIGTALIQTLIQRCTELGYRQMVAVIGDAANQGSLALHGKNGFKEIGRLPSAGFKFRRWYDAVFMQRALGDGSTSLPEN